MPVAAHAATTGSGGWYWPVGTENFHGWDGWWTYRPQHPPRWHEAQDMPCAVGHAVYAIGDGTILEAGGDHGYGGVIVVLHKTGEGKYFKAVYGHMHPSKGIKKGGKVKAGQVVGHVNGAAHLHFGVHPGKAYPPDNNPYRGHTYDSSKTYGWVDPVKYLRGNPRVCTIPAPPVVATVETTAQPTVLGTANGTVFWSTGDEDDRRVFSRAILDKDAKACVVDAVPEGLDTARYTAKESASSFTLTDTLPKLTLVCSDTTPAWKHAVTVSGKLTSASGGMFVGARINVESSTDGTTWTKIGSALSGAKGTYSWTFTPTRQLGLRTRFAPSANYLPVASAVTTVTPHPAPGR